MEGSLMAGLTLIMQRISLYLGSCTRELVLKLAGLWRVLFNSIGPCKLSRNSLAPSSERGFLAYVAPLSLPLPLPSSKSHKLFTSFLPPPLRNPSLRLSLNQTTSCLTLPSLIVPGSCMWPSRPWMPSSEQRGDSLSPTTRTTQGRWWSSPSRSTVPLKTR